MREYRIREQDKFLEMAKGALSEEDFKILNQYFLPAKVLHTLCDVGRNMCEKEIADELELVGGRRESDVHEAPKMLERLGHVVHVGEGYWGRVMV